MKNEHPVKWLLENATSAIYRPLHDWMEEVMGSSLDRPQVVTMPD